MAAWEFWKSNGIVTGGQYNSTEGCQPYEIPACDHHVVGKLKPCGNILPTPKCKKTCEADYKPSYEDDKNFGMKTLYHMGNNKNKFVCMQKCRKCNSCHFS